MTTYEPLIHYVLGFASCIFALLIYGLRIRIRKPPKPKPWKRIDSMKFTTEFQIEPDWSMSGLGIASGIAKAFIDKAAEMDFEVKPGNYDVRVWLEATFTEREEEESE